MMMKNCIVYSYCHIFLSLYGVISNLEPLICNNKRLVVVSGSWLFYIIFFRLCIKIQLKTACCVHKAQNTAVELQRPWSTMECSQPAVWITNRSLIVASRVRPFQEDRTIPSRPYPEQRTWMVV